MSDNTAETEVNKRRGRPRKAKTSTDESNKLESSKVGKSNKRARDSSTNSISDTAAPPAKRARVLRSSTVQKRSSSEQSALRSGLRPKVNSTLATQSVRMVAKVNAKTRVRKRVQNAKKTTTTTATPTKNTSKSATATSAEAEAVVESFLNPMERSELAFYFLE